MSPVTRSLPVFFDPAGRRWPRVRRVWLALAVLISLLAATLVASVLINPVLPQLSIRSVSTLRQAVNKRLQATSLPKATREQKVGRVEPSLRRSLTRTRTVLSEPLAETVGVRPAPTSPPSVNSLTKPLAIGFYVNWDDSSYESLKRNIAELDWLVPEWGRLQDGSDPLVRDIDPRVLDLVSHERSQMPIVPLVQNYWDGRWEPAVLERALVNETSRARLVDALVRFVGENKFAGVCIDFEQVPAASQANLQLFMQSLHATFSPLGLVLAQAVPFDDPDWDLRVYAASTDYLLLMAYDQHWSGSAAGPIAGQDWFERNLALLMGELEPAKTIICIGNYGYNWSGSQATEITFQEAVLAARDSEAAVSFDLASRNPYFSYEEEDGSTHTVWFLDAVTVYNQILAASKFHPAGYALWRLGSEDPSLWEIFGAGFGREQTNFSPDRLQRIRFGYDVDFEGTGEILQVSAQPQEGSRRLKTDSITGLVDQENYITTPSSYVIRRSGDQPGLVALTFDDGPDPLWTPRILEILRQENVPATFFIIGANGQANPEIMRRIVDEGHDIGNHTYTHPNLGDVPGRVTDFELNATQRLIESETGRGTILFRPPYFGDAEPTTPDEVDPIVRATRLGYLTIGLRVDPGDWAVPGTNEIVKRTVAGVTETNPDRRGQVVLLHDGGGDRQQTVDALPQIIHELRARKFRFVTVSQLAGLTRDQTMPTVPSGQELFTRANAVTFSGLSLSEWLLHWIFGVGILFGLARVIFIGALAFGHWRRRNLWQATETHQPFVSVIVPAYNEELVIAKTIESLLASTYPAFEIIVVDDGSSDRTSEVVADRFADENRVQLFTKQNGGKAESLNFGIRYARGEIIVALDADTLFTPDTIGALAHGFHDPSVAAVAGNAKVGNRINLLTRLQALEYITSQNMDRRAFASLNCITVVPGAVGAWRRDLVERAGGFSSDTLAEDQDLTLKIRRLGYRVSYEENAIAWTEAPASLNTLAKQRFRWCYGSLQCMWKHRDALLRRRYGTLGVIAMPNIWVFQILFPLIAPVMDLMLVWTLVSAALERLEHPVGYVTTNLLRVLFFYVLFLTVDWLAAAFALLLEKHERWSLLWWLFLQRFCYRQLMYYVMIRSVICAARGTLIGWGKLERKATAEAQP